jgi:hypothetical protein
VTANAVDPDDEAAFHRFLARVDYYEEKTRTYWLVYHLRELRLLNSFARDEFVPHEPTEAELASWLERILTE